MEVGYAMKAIAVLRGSANSIHLAFRTASRRTSAGACTAPRSAACRSSGRVMEEQVTNGRLGALALHGVSALTGGIPLVVDGEVVGAIGTSGETPDEDEAISLAGAAADYSTVTAPALTYDGARRAAEAANA